MQRGSRRKMPPIRFRVVVDTIPLKWTMTRLEGRDDYLFSRDPTGDEPIQDECDDPRVEFDCTLIRDLFLAIRTPEDALKFFQKTDFWDTYTFLEIQELQRFVKRVSRKSFATLIAEAKLDPGNQYLKELTDTPLFTMVWEGGKPELRCDANQLADTGILAVIGALMQIDALMGIRERACARPDCWMLFAVDGRSDKQYCSRNCANVVRNRKKKRAASGVKARQ